MTTPISYEICYMLDFRSLREVPANCQRIYFGHETCEKLLPTFDEIGGLLEISEKRGLGLTFVTPFLTEQGMEKVLLFLEKLQSAMPRSGEIVTSDWGLIHQISKNNIWTPVVSRLIAGQQVDFRLVNTTERSSPAMLHHLSSCTLMKNRTAELFRQLGVHRFELSNVFQPMTLAGDQPFRCSLHVPFVPLTIFRTCPEGLDFNRIKKPCHMNHCSQNRQRWQYRYSKHAIYCLHNALYYSNPDQETQLKRNASIDRIVCHDEM